MLLIVYWAFVHSTAFLFISWYVHGMGACSTLARTPFESPLRKNCMFSWFVIIYPALRLVSSNVAIYSSILGNFIFKFSSLFLVQFSFWESRYCCSNASTKVSHMIGSSSIAGFSMFSHSPIIHVHPNVTCPFMNVKTIVTLVIEEAKPITCQL